jgi:tape measure domain-containing protein
MPTEFNLKINADATGLIKNVGKSVQSIAELEGTSARTTRKMGAAFKGLAIIASAGLGLDTIQRYGDMLVDATNRLALLTNSTSELDNTMQALFKTSKETRTSFEGTAIVYSRVALALRDTKASTEEVINFTSTLNKAIILSGTKSVEAGQALIQLSQGMASGALRGDELRSVMEQLPYVADLIADKMGVFRASLRLLGREGKITTKIVRDAITEATEGVDEAFKKTTVSVSQAGNYLETSFLEAFKSLNDSIPLANMLAKSIMLLADNAGVLGRAIFVLTTALTALNIKKQLIDPVIEANRYVKVLGLSLHKLNLKAVTANMGKFKKTLFLNIIAPFTKASKQTALYQSSLDRLKNSLKVTSKTGARREGVASDLAEKSRALHIRKRKLKKELPKGLSSTHDTLIEQQAKAKNKLDSVNKRLSASQNSWNEKLAKGAPLTKRHSQNIQSLYKEKHRLTQQTNKLAGALTASHSAMLTANSVATKKYNKELSGLNTEINNNQAAMSTAAAATALSTKEKEKLTKQIDMVEKKMGVGAKKTSKFSKVMTAMLAPIKGMWKGLLAIAKAFGALSSSVGGLVTLGLLSGTAALAVGGLVTVVVAVTAAVFILSGKLKLMTFNMADGSKKVFSLLDGIKAFGKVLIKQSPVIKTIRTGLQNLSEWFKKIAGTESIWQAWFAIFIAGWTTVSTLFNTVFESIGHVIGGIYDLGKSILTFNLDSLRERLEKVKGTFSRFAGLFTGKTIADNINETYKAMADTAEIDKAAETYENLTKTLRELQIATDKVFNTNTSFLNKVDLEKFEVGETLDQLFMKGGVGEILDDQAIDQVLKDLGDSTNLVIKTLKKLEKQGVVTAKALKKELVKVSFENKKFADSFKEIDKAITDLKLDPLEELLESFKVYASISKGRPVDQLSNPALSKKILAEAIEELKKYPSLVRAASDALFDLKKPIEALETPLQKAQKELANLSGSEFMVEAKNQLIDFAEEGLKNELFQAIKDGTPLAQELLDKIKSFNKNFIDPSKVTALAKVLKETANTEFFKSLVAAKTVLEDISDIVKANNSGIARSASEQDKINKAYKDAVETKYDELIPDKTLTQNLQERLKLARMTSFEQEAYSLAKEEQDRLNRKSLENIKGLTGDELEKKLKILNLNEDQLVTLQAQSLEMLRQIDNAKRLSRVTEQALSAQFVAPDLIEAINVYKQVRDQISEDPITSNILSREIESMEMALLSLGPASNGVELGLRQVQEQTKLTANSVANELVNAFGHAEDAMVEFFMTGKLGFKEMINSMIADLVRFATQKFIINAIVGGLSNMGSSPTTTGIEGANPSQPYTPGPGMASGGITSGGLTMVGERGPEIAAFPKNTRIMSYMDSMRALGAASSSGNGAAPINVTVNQNIESSGQGQASDQDMLDKVAVQTRKAIKESIQMELKEQQRPRNMLNKGMSM